MAIRTWRGTTNSNWGTAANWQELAVPTTIDDVIFDAVSPACTVNVAGSALTITFAAYANTITMSNSINVLGNITLGSGMTFAGTAAIVVSAAANLTSNGKAIPSLTFSQTATFTLIDDWTVSTLLTLVGSFQHTINGTGRILNVSGGLTHTSVNNTLGTATINFNGTGTWNMTSTGAIRNNVTINTAGTLTINNVNYNTGTLTYTAGTINATGLLNIILATTLNCAGMSGTNSWNNITVTGNTTLTTNDLYTKGLLTLGSTSNAVVINATSGIKTLTSSGGITTGVTSGSVVCNANIKATGGTLRGNPSNAGFISLTGYTFEIDGNITLSNTGYFYLYGGASSTGIFKWTSGVVTSTGSLIQFNAMVIDSAGMVFNRVTILNGTGQTTTLTTNLTTTGVVTLGNSTITQTINGSMLTAGGGVTLSGTSTIILGTTILRVSGGSIASVSAVQLRLHLELAGNVNFSTNLFYNTGSLTYISGTITFSPVVTLTSSTSLTFNTNGMTWNNITFTTSGSTLTLLSNFQMSGLLNTSGSFTFVGAFDADLGSITTTIAGSILTLVAGQTYNLTGAITLAGTLSAPIQLRSSSTPSVAYFNSVNNGTSTRDVGFVTTADIDSSGGLTIYDYKGIITNNTTNWAVLPTDVRTMSYGYSV
jgi:hypothetical protein